MKYLSNEIDIQFPKCFDIEKSIDALIEMHDEKLYDFFGVKDKAAFTRRMNPYFPNKPARVSFCKYLQDVLEPVKTKKSGITFETAEMRKQREEDARFK